jgi:transposase
MEYFVGLDVPIDETAICVVDDKGTVTLSSAVATETEMIAEVLRPYAGRLRRVAHEAGSLSPWLYPAGTSDCLPGNAPCGAALESAAQ